MTKEEFDSVRIQTLIGYDFKNPMLLQQAFTRRSYSQEHTGCQDNEVLEFYGDTALNLYISRSMSESFGKIEENQYVSEKNEGELSEIRSWSVSKNRLSHCIKILELEKYLFLSSTDMKNEVWKNDSVCEDLFEAIIGAVSIDSNWNSDCIKKVCQNLFSVSDFNENYIKLLEEECLRQGLGKPRIWDSNYFRCFSSISDHTFMMNPSFHREQSLINFPENFAFEIKGLINRVSEYNPTHSSTKTKSIMLSAQKHYEWLLRRNKIQKSIGEIDESFAVNQLHELHQKGLISEPVYSFSESHDENGNPIWHCSCKLAEAEWAFEATDSSKKIVKQKAAAEALFFLVGKEYS